MLSRQLDMSRVVAKFRIELNVRGQLRGCVKSPERPPRARVQVRKEEISVRNQQLSQRRTGREDLLGIVSVMRDGTF